MQLKAECEESTLEKVHFINFYWIEGRPKVIKPGSSPDAELRLRRTGTDGKRGVLVMPTFLEQGADMILRQPWMADLEITLWTTEGDLLHSTLLTINIQKLCNIPLEKDDD